MKQSASPLLGIEIQSLASTHSPNYHGFSSSRRELLFFPPPLDQGSSAFLPHPPKPKPNPKPSFESETLSGSPFGVANGLAKYSAGCGCAGGAARGGIPELGFEGVDQALNPKDDVDNLLEEAAAAGGDMPESWVYAGEPSDGEVAG